ncbi:hypothetical protein D9Q98_007583 [Chlorella vulgaris]|uniref:Uncharacterized protein n=1 Tax=Chlorella vulgaris TaxID=3077 RepID=A0A9D4TLD7_CHLVU|nr:hypothetical protein D9Q98_007583 [Chlorella vulgaris]
MRSFGILLLGLVVLGCVLATEPDGPVDRRRGPWFCHKKDCPAFKTVREEADYTLRCYERSTWAVSCAHDVYMPDGVLRATASLLNYIKENELFGGTPLAFVSHLSLENQEAWLAWNRTVSPADVAAKDAELPGPSPAGDGDGVGAGNWLHRTVCAAYFLPSKYQAGDDAEEPGSQQADRRPPRPGRKSHVHIIRARRFEAFVTGFRGFATPPRSVWEAMRLAHALTWHREWFDWTTSLLFQYDPPTQVEGRWNEVLIPAKRWHDLLGEGEDVFAEEGVSVQ